jgi:histidinol phosphatase-like enzyme
MIFRLAKKWHIDCARSLVIGDRPSDVEAGTRAGCHSYLIENEQRLDEVARRLLKMLGMLV